MKKFLNFKKGDFWKEHKSKVIIPLVLLLSIALLSVIGVAANTVPYTVIDGEENFVVSIIFPDEKVLAEKAEEIGLNPVSELDDLILDEENRTLTVKRAVNVTVDIEGTLSVIHANVGQTVGDALKEANLNTDGKYKVLPSTDTVIESDMSLRLNDGYIVKINGEEFEIMGNNVKSALEEAKIGFDEDDGVTPSLETPLHPGMEISFIEGYKVLITNGSFTAETSTFALTVDEFLEERGISLGEKDKLSVPASTVIKDGTEIVITRVYTVNETVTEATAFSTEIEPNFDFFWGGSELKTPGVKGVDQVTYSCTYENGVLISKEETGRVVIKEPVNEIVYKRPTSDYQNEVEAAVINNEGGGNYFIDHNGNKVYYKRQLYGSGTAYCIPDGITSVGLPVGRGMVAVDPKIIPYGSKLYITCGSYCYGYGIAGDTGGALMAGTALVDLYMDTLEDCTEFGRRNMTVYIIE